MNLSMDPVPYLQADDEIHLTNMAPGNYELDLMTTPLYER